MSAANDMANMMTRAVSMSSSLSANARQLVRKAVTAIEKPIRLRMPIKIREQGTSMPEEPRRKQTDTPAAFPEWTKIEFGNPPLIPMIDEVSADLAVAFPALQLPSFQYQMPPSPPSFTATPPVVGPFSPLPPAPESTNFTSVQLLPLVSLNKIDIQLEDTEFMPDTIKPLPAFDSLETLIGKYKALLMPEVDQLLQSLNADCRRIVDSLLPDLMTFFTARFSNRYSHVLAEREAIVQRAEDRFFDVQSQLFKFLNDTSGQQYPDLVINAARMSINQWLAAQYAEMGRVIQTKETDIALATFENAAEMFIANLSLISKLRESGIEQTMQGIGFAITYAKLAAKAIISDYEFEHIKKYKNEFSRAELEMKQAEFELQIALLDYEVAEANLVYLEGQQETDQQKITEFKHRARKAKTDVENFARNLTVAKVTYERGKAEVEMFAFYVEAFDASIEAFEAAITYLVARIEGDESKAEAQLLKVKEYQAKSSGFIETIRAKQQVVEAQSDRNDALIAVYKQQVESLLGPVQQAIYQNSYLLKKYEANAKQIMAELQFSLDKMKTDKLYENEKAESGVREVKDENELNLQRTKIELQRLEALAAAFLKGASENAGMGLEAMHAINAIATAIFNEEE